VLTWQENVPVVSWLVQLGRCRGCGWRIPVRYPLVELLTAGLWLLVAALTLPAEPAAGDWGLFLVRVVVLSGLVVATFVDFAHFEIPDEVSIGGMVLAPLASLLVPELHRGNWLALWAGGGELDRVSALIGCLGGMAVGGGVLLAVGWLGKRAFGREAMGLGDVKLLAAAGGFVGPLAVLMALVLGSLSASVAGIGNMGRMYCVSRRRVRLRGARKPRLASLASARIAGRYIPFGPYLALGIAIVLLYWDALKLWL
jgi:leader peptidase (prepilin peptidase)/N-methyltransferase